MKNYQNFFSYLMLFFSISVFSQKKILDHKDFEIWNTIQMPTISSNGEYVMYSLLKGEKTAI